MEGTRPEGAAPTLTGLLATSSQLLASVWSLQQRLAGPEFSQYQKLVTSYPEVWGRGRGCGVAGAGRAAARRAGVGQQRCAPLAASRAYGPWPALHPPSFVPSCSGASWSTP